MAPIASEKEYSASKTLNYTYNAAGHIASMTDSNGQQTACTYTDTGRLDTITAPGSKVWNWDYNNLGQKTQYTHPNGTRTEYGYDTRHRLTSIVHKDASNNAVLDSFTFTLDTEGNITQVLHADGTKWVYTHDTRHRLTDAYLRDSANSIMRIHTYAYDVANNLTGKTRTITSSASYAYWTYGYDNANQQTSATMNGGTAETRTYDDWGRMATRTQGTSSATFGYRYGGRLYNYTTNFGGETAETMQYRGDGRLYSRTAGGATKVYRYDRGWNTINEEDGAGNLAYTSVYAPGTEVGERLAYSWGAIATAVTFYAYHDQLGSTRAWRWPTKGLVGRDDFAPYGEPITTTTLAPIDYALHVQDPNTLLYHAAYREYAAGWARWTTRDPLGMVDGPNMYAYVGDSPTTAVDEMGLIGPIALAWILLRLGVGGYALAECIGCMSNASATDQLAKHSLCYDDYVEWRNHARPGSECALICGVAAAALVSVILGQLGKVVRL